MARRIFVQIPTSAMARAEGVHPTTMRRRARRGLLKAEKVKGRWRYEVSTEQAARGYGVRVETIRRRARAGKISSRRRAEFDPHWVERVRKSGIFPSRDLDKWAEVQPPWMDDAMMPAEFGVLLYAAGAPHPDNWANVDIKVGENQRAPWIITITDKQGKTYTMRFGGRNDEEKEQMVFRQFYPVLKQFGTPVTREYRKRGRR